MRHSARQMNRLKQSANFWANVGNPDCDLKAVGMIV
jgi:hypothetical protein